MRKLFFLLVGLLAASCVSPVPAEAQVNASVAMDKTNSWLRSTNFIRSNWFAGSGILFTFGTNGSVTISTNGAAAAGTVTSVDLSAPSFLTVGGNPVTTSGTLTLTLADQAEKKVFIGPASGADAAPTFRLLQAGDIPDLSAVYQPLDTQLTSVAGLSYSGNAGKVIAVNGGETGFELITAAGGGATFNANQFGASVLGTNIKSGATVTNIQFYSYADLVGNGLRWNDGSDVILAQQRNGTNLFFSLNGNDIVTINDSFVAPSSGAALLLGNSSDRWVTLYSLTANVLGSITNDALTASRMVYSDANKVLTSASFSPTAIEPWANSNTNMLRTVTNNFSVYLQAGDTDEIDMSLASSTNVLSGALTIAHATNGLAGYERTHVRWLWAGGADRALTIPTNWKTNVYSAVPANITNGTITKMYVTTIGDTSSSANQTNVFVSFEFYK